MEDLIQEMQNNGTTTAASKKYLADAKLFRVLREAVRISLR